MSLAVEPEQVAQLEQLRRPLTAYCYRMLGGSGETDDAVQETLLRATVHLETFDPARGPLRPWVFRIATNVCLDLLRGAKRRAVAIDLGPASVAGAALGDPLSADRWVEPLPDARLLTATDPAELAVERESVRLALVAALQHLPPRQRAVLLLRDVLRFTAEETAQQLGTSVAAVTSALQRARATLEVRRPTPADALDPTDPAQQELLRRYVRAFETHDVEALRAVLHEDARSSMPPFAWWVAGRETLATLMTSGGCEGARLVTATTSMSGGAGFGQYRPADDGTLRPFALVLVELRDAAVGHVMTFLGTRERFVEFGLPEVLLSPTDEFGPAAS